MISIVIVGAGISKALRAVVEAASRIEVRRSNKVSVGTMTVTSTSGIDDLVGFDLDDTVSVCMVSEVQSLRRLGICVTATSDEYPRAEIPIEAEPPEYLEPKKVLLGKSYKSVPVLPKYRASRTFRSAKSSKVLHTKRKVNRRCV